MRYIWLTAYMQALPSLEEGEDDPFWLVPLSKFDPATGVGFSKSVRGRNWLNMFTEKMCARCAVDVNLKH